ncbi:MAG: DNA recombination protein RmuC [Prevotellaceae bacterium]|nr:DNA recombination protein RmuC [Prevotellaceae bacterium]
MAVAFVFLLVGLVLGLVVGMLLTKSRMLEEKTSLVASRNVLQNETDQLRRQLSEQEKRHTSQIDELRQQQKEQLEQQSALIREQINNASEQILKKRAEELQRNNTEQLSTILTPLHERLQQMREAVEKSERGQTLAMERLDAVIKENLRQVHEVGERADKLAEALTSENKTQGDFGELRLRTLLINMGLEEGVQFEEQATMRDERGKTIYEEENGRRMMPDVILHFPDDRDVIIDSKMSLKAFEEYFNAESEEDKDRALTRHIASVRSHVKELAHKNYSSYIRKGRQKLDFVLMYVYSESALQLALANDVTLWKEAYDQGVVISGSQNLYMILRVLEMTWRQVRQAENQEEIMKVADEVVNRVQMFYERFLDVEDQLEKTRKAFDSLKTNTSPSGKSIITAASKLLDYGARENPKRKVSLGAAYRD